jgi:hypothetical protein
MRLEMKSVIKRRAGRNEMRTKKSFLIAVVLTLALLGVEQRSYAYENYAMGHISDVTFAGDMLLVRMDVAAPSNCASTSFGWMKIPATERAMQSFVTALLG